MVKDDDIALMDDKEEDKKNEEAKVVDIVTTAKLITEVVTAASKIVTTASIIIAAVEWARTQDLYTINPFKPKPLPLCPWDLSVLRVKPIGGGSIRVVVDEEGKVSANCLNKFGQIAYECLLTSLKDKPTMTNVLSRLEFVLRSANDQKRNGRTTFIEKARLLLSTKAL
nr:serine/threonine/dual specificity protein kinase, catalytic domain-containing protein [Tanacetum cinerariifolium]